MVGLTGVAQSAELCCSESAYEPERKQEAGMPQGGNGDGGTLPGANLAGNPAAKG